ncbi:helix-turn-helix transcriptional regulator [Flavobacterium zhairuonense]|uniref:helix-turn-helix transcriptional regulator n=1 Tax=Flavobacterium zhairuonense TaxID=2493631 RepID=UPI001045E3A1|nr:helix-turn-helix transcriptional regulator [Flavobacterium zhairuonense]KAF2507709.1 helix-turn-helix transcriptional regulator [Flavobacterium zhairuonense]
MEHEKLIKARKEKGFTQKEMAEMLAMEQTTYSKKERGISRIRENEWESFAKILDKDIEAIKGKMEDLTSNHESNHITNLNVIEIIIKYTQKLEEENFLLKELLNRQRQKTEKK